MFRPMNGRARAIVPLVLAAWSFTAGTAHAVDGYAGLQAGTHFWPAYSNRDQVEADTTPGASWAVVLGLDLGSEDLPAQSGLRSALSPSLRLRLEVEVGQRFSDLHGVNDDMGQRTADGKTVQATSALFNLWPSWTFAEGWSAYLGGGIGNAWVRTLGSDKSRLALQGGAGVLIELPTEAVPIRIDVGWRSYFASSAEYRDRLVDYNTHGPVVGVHFGF